uniref:(northern house mosquito) hypothetical protein n=1 Tax=Culex pipiens TaxID=7175 RepID=A0A8D8FZF1_CULPI
MESKRNVAQIPVSCRASTSVCATLKTTTTTTRWLRTTVKTPSRRRCPSGSSHLRGVAPVVCEPCRVQPRSTPARKNRKIRCATKRRPRAKATRSSTSTRRKPSPTRMTTRARRTPSGACRRERRPVRTQVSECCLKTKTIRAIPASRTTKVPRMGRATTTRTRISTWETSSWSDGRRPAAISAPTWHRSRCSGPSEVGKRWDRNGSV